MTFIDTGDGGREENPSRSGPESAGGPFDLQIFLIKIVQRLALAF
jgi:hypothetical protein